MESPQHKENWASSPIGTTLLCLATEECPREQILSLLDPDASLIERVNTAATAVATCCGGLGIEAQKQCAADLFEVPLDCSLTRWFRVVYEAERQATSVVEFVQ